MTDRTIRDLIRGEPKSRDPDPRYLKPILETIASCLNIGVSAVRLGEDGASPTVLVRSFQNPFLQILRDRPEIRAAEDGEIIAAVSARPGEPVHLPCTWLDSGGRFETLVLPSSEADLYLVVGPVVLRDQSGGDPLARKSVRDQVCAQIEAFYRAHHPDEPKMPELARVRRFLTQRSAIAAGDIESRARDLREALEAVLAAEVHADPVSADFLEALAKTVTFWVRRRNRTNGGTTRNVHRLHQFEDGEDEPFTLEISRVADDRLRFVTHAGSDGLHVPLEREELARWGQFCDEFRTCRNFHFHEQLTLLRLWMQDKFTGVTLKEESGEDNRELFNALAAKIAEFAGGDICVIHRYLPGESVIGGGNRQGYLDPIGVHTASANDAQYLKSEFENLRRIGAKETTRSKSACYRCIDQHPPQPVLIPTVRDDDDVATITALDPKSVLVSPLVSRDRVWGVLELIGRKPGQLQRRIERWVAEIARIITQPLYTQWMFYHIREMSGVAASGALTQNQKYTALLDHVRKLLLASSARLYLQDTTRTSEFRMAAHAGHAWRKDTATQFDLTNKKNATTQTIEADLLWRTGKLGEEPFTSPDIDRNLDPLIQDGHRYVAVIPIKAHDGNTFASMMITSMDNEPFPEEWSAIVETISRQLTVILEQIYLQLMEESSDKGFLAHSVKTRIDRVNEGGERFLGMIGPLYEDEHLLRQMPRFIAIAETAIMQTGPQGQRLNQDTRELLQALKRSFPFFGDNTENKVRDMRSAYFDLRTHLEALRVAAIVLSGGENSEHFQFAYPDTWTGTPATLRECLKQSLKPLVDRAGYEGRLVVPPISVLGHDVRVRVPEQLLVEILNNLLDNAFKYDFSVPSVAVQVRQLPGSPKYAIEIRNTAPTLTAAQAKKIARGGERADYANARNRDGTGVGLHWCFEMADRWGLSLVYTPPVSRDPAHAGKEMGTHLVRLEVTNVGRERRR